MTSTDSLQAAIDIAENLWSESERDPEDGKWWGFFCYGDASAPIGGGNGSFVWFPDRDEMLDFIRQVLPYSPPGRSDMDWEKVAKETEAIIDQMRGGDIDDKAATNHLNEALRSFSQIEWIGTFDDLLEGSHSYARLVRTEFRDSVEDATKQSDPIDEIELKDFKEFAALWGI
jgi:hypothetical protein